MWLLGILSCALALWALPMDKSVMAVACDLLALAGSQWCLWIFFREGSP